MEKSWWLRAPPAAGSGVRNLKIFEAAGPADAAQGSGPECRQGDVTAAWPALQRPSGTAWHPCTVMHPQAVHCTPSAQLPAALSMASDSACVSGVRPTTPGQALPLVCTAGSQAQQPQCKHPFGQSQGQPTADSLQPAAASQHNPPLEAAPHPGGWASGCRCPQTESGGQLLPGPPTGGAAARRAYGCRRGTLQPCCAPGTSGLRSCGSAPPPAGRRGPWRSAGADVGADVMVDPV